MENASKALLIAASVLIVILLIAVGMRIFNSTTGVTDSVESTMDATEVAMFNNQFIRYTGKYVTVNEVKALLNVVISNNGNNSKKVEVRLISDVGSKYWTEDISQITILIACLNQLNGNELMRVLISKGWSSSTNSWSSGYDEKGYVKSIYIEQR